MSVPTQTLRNDKSFAVSLAGNGGTVSDPDAASRKNLLLLIQLRWLAVAGQVLTILVTEYWFDIPLPLPEMASVVLFLVGLNIFSLLASRGQRPISNAQLFVALIFDMAALTTQLYLSGGASNPFVSLYLLQITLGAALLTPWSTWSLVARLRPASCSSPSSFSRSRSRITAAATCWPCISGACSSASCWRPA